MNGITYNERSYNGKDFKIPVFPADQGFTMLANPLGFGASPDSRILRRMNQPWDTRHFLEPEQPLIIGELTDYEKQLFCCDKSVPNVLDMPIKFPYCADFRIPSVYRFLAPTIQRIINGVAEVNPLLVPKYFCYMTFRHWPVRKGMAQHEAPCHVDGFQGARWNPKCLVNHTVTVASGWPTDYFIQPFDFSQLDEAKHDFFWEMNYQVAQTNGKYRWSGKPFTMELMDAYCVHRAAEVNEDTYRWWLRLSFEEERRIFDRLGNAHNPLFAYSWDMVPRDIEQLGLVAFHADCDPTLRVFPWQAPDGSKLPKGERTKPNLWPKGRSN